MFRTKKYFFLTSFVRKRLIKKSQPEFSFKDFFYRSIYSFMGDNAFFYHIQKGIIEFRTMHMHIHTRIKCQAVDLFKCFTYTMIILHPFYIHPITDDNAFEVPFFTQKIIQQFLTGMTWDTIIFIVSCHYCINACFYTSLERGKKNLTQCPLRKIGRSTVHTINRLTSAHKMLGTGNNIFLTRKTSPLKPFHRSYSQTRNQIGIFSKSIPDSSPSCITGNFNIRSECPLRTGSSHLKCCLSIYYFYQFRVK